MRYAARIDGRSVLLEVDARGRLHVDGAVAGADVVELAPGALYSVLVDGRSHEVAVLGHDPLRIWIDGRDVAVALEDEREHEARIHAAEGGAAWLEVRAPMPGLIVAVHVGEGDVVEGGASVCTLEAMKMENELTVPRRARVTRLAVAPGAKVNGGDLLVVLAAE